MVLNLVSAFHRGSIVADRDSELSFREIDPCIGRNQVTLIRMWDWWVQEKPRDRQEGLQQSSHHQAWDQACRAHGSEGWHWNIKNPSARICCTTISFSLYNSMPSVEGGNFVNVLIALFDSTPIRDCIGAWNDGCEQRKSTTKCFQMNYDYSSNTMMIVSEAMGTAARNCMILTLCIAIPVIHLVLWFRLPLEFNPAPL